MLGTKLPLECEECLHHMIPFHGVFMGRVPLTPRAAEEKWQELLCKWNHGISAFELPPHFPVLSETQSLGEHGH